MAAEKAPNRFEIDESDFKNIELAPRFTDTKNIDTAVVFHCEFPADGARVAGAGLTLGEHKKKYGYDLKINFNSSTDVPIHSLDPAQGDTEWAAELTYPDARNPKMYRVLECAAAFYPVSGQIVIDSDKTRNLSIILRLID